MTFYSRILPHGSSIACTSSFLYRCPQVPAPAPVFDYVMADTLTTIVIELLATPPQPQPQEGSSPLQYLVGWTSFVPFSEIREDGNAASVAVGVHRYTLEAPAGQRGLVLRDQPSLNWRAMLGDMMVQEVPEPLVEFQLFETGVKKQQPNRTAMYCLGVASLRLEFLSAPSTSTESGIDQGATKSSSCTLCMCV